MAILVAIVGHCDRKKKRQGLPARLKPMKTCTGRGTAWVLSLWWYIQPFYSFLDFLLRSKMLLALCVRKFRFAKYTGFNEEGVVCDEAHSAPNGVEVDFIKLLKCHLTRVHSGRPVSPTNWTSQTLHVSEYVTSEIVQSPCFPVGQATQFGVVYNWSFAQTGSAVSWD